MSLGAPQSFWGLLAIPFVVALFLTAEKRGEKRLREFVSARLLPQLAGTVNRFRRALRFALQLLGLAFALIALAQPRWGYTFQDVKRKGLDLLIAVDTSRSMLSNDVQPNRLERVKLAAQDLINELQGDRVGLIAFAGRAFLQAPLTIDYGAVVESINDLDTKTVPEGGTNISEAIALASRTFGKSAMGNRTLIIFTDGEELSGDAVKSAKAAADAGVRIFTVGVGTPQGSLIPISGENGETAFVKDSAGQVVKSKLDEKRLREVAQASGGFYLQLENGPRTMQQIYSEGLAQMQAAEFDVRLSRRPIERYEWPLGAALIALALSILIGERKRVRVPVRSHALLKLAPTAAALLLLSFQNASASAGLQLYRDGKYAEAYRSFQEDLKNHPDSAVKDKMQFDSGTAAYKMGDYDKAVEAFSEALLSREKSLQENSHFNTGRTLEERADMDKSDEDALTDLKNAQTHYEDALKLNPNNQAAKANLEAVKKKIERLKKHPKEKRPPPPQQQKDKKKEDSNQEQNGSNPQQQNQQQPQKDQQQQQSQSQDQQQQKDQHQQSQDRQSQNQSSSGQEQQNKNDQSQAKNQPQQSKQQNKPSPSPSAGERKENQDRARGGAQQSPTPGENGNETPSPSPGNGEETSGNATPSVTPSGSPQKTAPVAEAEPEKEGQMSERQAEALVQSMKDEEARVRLDEHKATRRVYNDW